MNLKDLYNKKIAVLGMGVNNQALLLWLIKHGVKNISVCDKNDNIVRVCRELLHRTSFESKYKFFKFQAGKNYLNSLDKFDIVFRTPGIPYLHSKIQKAKKTGVEISSQTKLFFDLCPAKIIGITGTKGKGTTAVLIYEILKQNFQFSIFNFQSNSKSKIQNNKIWPKIYLAGNIGKDPFEFLDKLTKDDWVVLELSSFQLQDLHKSPHIAVILNVTSDHLDHHKTTEEYRDAKLNIVRHQNKNDFAVINQDYLTSFKFASVSPTENDYYFSAQKSVDLGAFILDDKIVFRTEKNEYQICDTKDIKLLGQHNLENICAAITASYLAGADIKSIRNIVTSYDGREHRLELVRKYKGVKYYNDSASTIPETTIAAIKSFTAPIILVVGGSDKGANYSKLGKEISKSKNIKGAILVGKTAKKIELGIRNYELRIKKKTNIKKFQSFNKAVESAIKLSKSGDIVLLSPASASFDMFKNYEERGNTFKKIINNIK